MPVPSGNLTQDGRWVYTGTAENRLRKMETRSGLPAGVPNLTLEFKYDHMGRRIQKVIKDNGTIVQDRQFVCHGWQLLWELDSASAFKRLFTWGPDVSHTLEGAGTVGGLLHVLDVSGAWDSWASYPCYDGNGNVMGLVGYAYGNILCKYEYDPYGKLVRTSGNTDLAASNPFLFSTKFLDRETGLSYYGYRYYSAEKGRWVNRDPVEEKDGFNLYSFLSNNCNTRVDSKELLQFRQFEYDNDGDPYKYASATHCGDFHSMIEWVLDKGEDNGVIMQAITLSADVTTCDGLRLDRFNRDSYSYFEAWVVRDGKIITSNRDRFWRKYDPGNIGFKCTKGQASWNAHAWFQSGDLPDNMYPGNVNEAGNIPSSEDPPTGIRDSYPATRNGVIVRDVEYEWGCSEKHWKVKMSASAYGGERRDF